MEREAAFKFELTFCIFLAVLAFLSRGHEGLVYPHFLLSVLGLLVVNLAAVVWLRRRSAGTSARALITLGDLASVTAIVAYSGGHDSRFWVIYALPIYTACLLLDGRGLACVAAGTVLLNAGFQLAAPGSQPAAVLSLSLKSGVLLFAAVGGWLLIRRDRAQVESASRQTLELQLLGDRMQEVEAALQETEKVADLGFLSMTLMRDISTPLRAISSAAKILASTNPATHPSQPFIGEILRSVRLCASLMKRFVQCSQQQRLDLRPCQVGSMVSAAVKQCSHEAVRRGVELELVVEEGLPKVRASRAHLERAITNLLRRSLESMPDGGWITVRAGRSRAAGGSGRVEVCITDTGEAPALEKLNQELLATGTEGTLPTGSEVAVYLARTIIHRHGGSVRFSQTEQGGTRAVIELEPA